MKLLQISQTLKLPLFKYKVIPTSNRCKTKDKSRKLLKWFQDTNNNNNNNTSKVKFKSKCSPTLINQHTKISCMSNNNNSTNTSIKCLNTNLSIFKDLATKIKSTLSNSQW